MESGALGFAFSMTKSAPGTIALSREIAGAAGREAASMKNAQKIADKVVQDIFTVVRNWGN
jgi:hypothetical protein